MINNLSIAALIMLAAGTLFWISARSGDHRDPDQVKPARSKEHLKQ